MMATTTPNQLALLAQADLLLLAGRFFAPPTVEIARNLTIEESDLQALLLQATIVHPEALATAIQQTVQQLPTMTLDDWIAEYNRLFEGGVACPINESGFVRRDKGAILGDIAGFYRAFGFQLSERASEKVDHLVCQLEFVALLLVMLAKARDEEPAIITHDALSAFSFDHLSEWLPAFCTHLSVTTTLPFYQMAAEVLARVWSQIVALNHLPLPEQIAEGIHEETGTPYECDRATREALIQ